MQPNNPASEDPKFIAEQALLVANAVGVPEPKRLSHFAGEYRIASDGTAYRILPSGSWKKLDKAEAEAVAKSLKKNMAEGTVPAGVRALLRVRKRDELIEAGE